MRQSGEGNVLLPVRGDAQICIAVAISRSADKIVIESMIQQPRQLAALA